MKSGLFALQHHQAVLNIPCRSIFHINDTKHWKEELQLHKSNKVCRCFSSFYLCPSSTLQFLHLWSPSSPWIQAGTASPAPSSCLYRRVGGLAAWSYYWPRAKEMKHNLTTQTRSRVHTNTLAEASSWTLSRAHADTSCACWSCWWIPWTMLTFWGFYNHSSPLISSAQQTAFSCSFYNASFTPSMRQAFSRSWTRVSCSAFTIWCSH